MPLIQLRTEDNKIISVDENIIQFSELLNTLVENYKNDLSQPLKGIKEKEINLLIKFCDACNYTKIIFDKPLWKKTFKNHYFATISHNEKLEKFYNEIDCDKLCELFKISYFYDSLPLKEFLYFKLYDIFNDENKTKEYFKKKDGNNIKKIIEIDDEKKRLLFNKYQDFINKQIETFTEEEINEFCNQYYL